MYININELYTSSLPRIKLNICTLTVCNIFCLLVLKGDNLFAFSSLISVSYSVDTIKYPACLVTAYLSFLVAQHFLSQIFSKDSIITLIIGSLESI